MTCFLCQKPITARQKVEHHHPIYKRRGGKQTSLLTRDVTAITTPSKVISRRGASERPQ